jgi:hypothetical protein
MLSITPIGYERFAIPVNPIRVRRPQPVPPRAEARRTEPMGPIQAALSRSDQKSRDPLEPLYLLTVETRRTMLDLDPEHPLNELSGLIDRSNEHNLPE